MSSTLLDRPVDELEKLLDDGPARACELTRRAGPGEPWRDCPNPAAWIIYLHFACGHRRDTSVLVCQECIDELLAGKEGELTHAILCAPDHGVCLIAATIKHVEPIR